MRAPFVRFMWATCAALPSVSARTVHGADDLARDVALAMLVHDGSIRSMEWTQSVEYDVPPPKVFTAESVQCFDEVGRWTMHAVTRLLGAPGSISGEHAGEIRIEDRMAFDGRRLVTCDEGSKSGNVTDDRGQRRSHDAVDCWLGRHLGEFGRERMGELLLGAPDLTMEYSTRGLPVVSGTVRLENAVFLLQVEVDPARGFAPRTITVRDRALRVPYYRYETTSFICWEGVWLPERGVREARMFAPTPEEATAFRQATAKRGVSRESDFFDPHVQSLFQEAVQEVFGADEARSAPLAPTASLTVRYTTLNQRLDPDRFTWNLSDEYRILDEYTGRFKLPHSAEWESATFPHSSRGEAP